MKVAVVLFALFPRADMALNVTSARVGNVVLKTVFHGHS